MNQKIKNIPRQKLDISLTVCICDTQSVSEAVREIFLARYPGEEKAFAIIEAFFSVVDQMYSGTYPGYHSCDTDYHDLRHILDVTLAAARLIDGHEKVHASDGEALGMERFLMGVTGAIFHDIGYIRHKNDRKHSNGAEYTKTHITRGVKFLQKLLPQYGKSSWVPRLSILLHYTGYERQIFVDDPKDHKLGCLMGTADLIAQMSDRAYLERCRDFLYKEFKIGNVVVPVDDQPGTPFESPVALLNQTPNFMKMTVSKRLEEMFNSVYRYAGDYFGGENLYMEGLHKNCAFLEELLQQKKLHLLGRKPR
ncbi:MAG: HD domain-containing protein [Pseudomonadales bacterium]|nr:HD domain-containing protein [Pseudomonadales bacterium]